MHLQAHRHRKVGRLLVRHGSLVRGLLLSGHPLCHLKIRQVGLRIGLQGMSRVGLSAASFACKDFNTGLTMQEPRSRVTRNRMQV